LLEYTAKEDVEYDEKLVSYDIRDNEAHVSMLHAQKIISREEAKKILSALEYARKLHYQNKFEVALGYEDVCMNVEKFVTQKVGEAGEKIHTARSRNDQILVDLRMFMRDEINELCKQLIELIEVLLKKSMQNKSVMPGYTHMQHAQPITFGYWLLAQASALFRNVERLEDVYTLVNQNPLGACALAGTSWNIDRNLTAKLLGFEKIQENALDVVSSRCEIEGDLLFACTQVMIHLSKMAQDLMLWSTFEYGFLELGRAWTTGSSIMPQKRNPDALELMRAKASDTISELVHVLEVQRGLPSGYNRDFQQTKKAIFQSIHTTKLSIQVMRETIASLKTNPKRMRNAAESNYSVATDLADYFARKGIPFRTAHSLVRGLVEKALREGKKLYELSEQDFASALRAHKVKANLAEVKRICSPENAVESHDSLGGTSSRQTSLMYRNNLNLLKQAQTGLQERKRRLVEAESGLRKAVAEIMGR
jgi:argininosuccinate lyase